MKASAYNFLYNFGGRYYVFNSLRRGLHRLDKDIYEVLQSSTNLQLTGISENHVQQLTENGYLVPNDGDEWQILQHQRNAAMLSKRLIGLTIAPTMDCNFGCPYCFEGSEKPKGMMTEDTMDAVVRFADALRDETSSGLEVFWFGGEPLLAVPQIEKLTHKLLERIVVPNDMAYAARIITNGYGLSRKVASRLAASRVASAQVTLDGPADVHDSRRFLKIGHAPTFDRIVDNIAESSDLLQITIRVNVDRDNRDGFRELASWLRQRIGDRVRVYPAFTIDVDGTYSGDTYCNYIEFLEDEIGLLADSPDLAREAFWYPMPKRLFCGAQHPAAWVITPEGSLHKCWNTINESSSSVGSVFSASEPERVARWESWGPSDACHQCKLAPLCMGGCPYEGLTKGSPQCIVSARTVEAALRAEVAAIDG